MQPVKKQGGEAARLPDPATLSPLADVTAAGSENRPPQRMSPARALQNRLVREINRPAQPWIWHSTGLVLTVLLALWSANLMINSAV